MKILYFQWNAFMQSEVEETFIQLNLNYDKLYMIPKDWNEDEVVYDAICIKLRQGNYTHVFSINFSPIVCQAIRDCGSREKYISWTHSVPMEVNDLNLLKYDFNRIFVFDKNYVSFLQTLGCSYVYHLPLATTIRKIIRKRPEFIHDLSMVGTLYNSEYTNLISPLKKYDRGYLDGLVEFQCLVNGANVIDMGLTEELIDRMNATYESKLESTDKFIPYNKRQLSYCMCREATRRNRIMAFLLLEGKVQTGLYTGDKADMLRHTYKGGYIDYKIKMPEVFRNSKVNLNITLSCIESGIPLRLLDIIGCGGVALSNSQPEIFEYFRPDIDIVCFDNMEELVNKALFLIKEDGVRDKLIENGLSVIEKAFKFSDRVNAMFNIQ